MTSSNPAEYGLISSVTTTVPPSAAEISFDITSSTCGGGSFGSGNSKSHPVKNSKPTKRSDTRKIDLRIVNHLLND
jgi:hypothetical protein